MITIQITKRQSRLSILSGRAWNHVKFFYLFGRYAFDSNRAFRAWVLKRRMSLSTFVYIINYCINNNLTGLVNYDGDTLMILYPVVLGKYDIIHFDGNYFERYVGAKELELDKVSNEGKLLVHAREYLTVHWRAEALDFILDNLDKAVVEVAP